MPNACADLREQGGDLVAEQADGLGARSKPAPCLLGALDEMEGEGVVLLAWWWFGIEEVEEHACVREESFQHRAVERSRGDVP